MGGHFDSGLVSVLLLPARSRLCRRISQASTAFQEPLRRVYTIYCSVYCTENYICVYSNQHALGGRFAGAVGTSPLAKEALPQLSSLSTEAV